MGKRKPMVNGKMATKNTKNVLQRIRNVNVTNPTFESLYHQCIISVSSSALCGTGYGSKAEIDCVNREQRKSGYMSALVCCWWSFTEHWAPIGGRLLACQWNERCAEMEVEAGGNERETIYTSIQSLALAPCQCQSIQCRVWRGWIAFVGHGG